jgi:hypothetical protein
MSKLDADANKVIDRFEQYIQRSAEYASEFYLKHNLLLVPFDGIKVTFTPEICASVYRNLIFDLIRNECAYKTKYNLSATLIILGEKDDKILFTIQLGLVFPTCK